MSQKQGPRRVELVTKVLAANERAAEDNRRRLREAGIVLIDVMGGPGAGKTALLEATIPRLAAARRTAVVVGDIATANDGERLAATGVPAVQIVTEDMGGACHLEAGFVAAGLDRLDLGALDLVFVENVGNLVCPAEFDLGHHARAVVLSVTEGEDKPLKYPLAFRVADAVVVSKIDLLPHLTVDLGALRANIRRINAKVPIFELSARSGEGLEPWLDWLRGIRGS
jgi:hydrogenase nickel incorporation protein HypB